MFICATTNKKNNTDNNNTHHSKFLSHATTHTFSQIIIFDTSDTQNHKTNLPVFMYHFGTHQHIIFSLYYVQFL